MGGDVTRPESTAGAVDRRLTRREVLRGGSLIVFGLVGSRWVALERFANATPEDLAFGGGQGPSHVVTMRRRDDLLHLRFECWNLKLSDDRGTKRLVRQNRNKRAYLIVVFPPQSVTERPFGENEDLVQPALQGVLAGESRLAFQVPAAVSSIDYNLESLLSWTQLEPRVVPAATNFGQPQEGQLVLAPRGEPEPNETAIEMPWRLILSPHAGLGWAHATGLVTHDGWTEIWHTRLGVRDGDTVDEWDPTGRTVKAVFTPDPDWLHEPLASLKQEERERIVTASSNPNLKGHAPIDVHRLMLTPLGGWLDVHGTWDDDAGDIIAEWRHQATMGRDHYVRVVTRGYLFPLGHPAVHVRIVERQFEPGPSGGIGAYLREREFIIVQQPTRRFDAPGQTGVAPGQPDEGRAWPFPRVRLTTLITPSIELGDDGLVLLDQGPATDDEPFLFAVTADDLEGHRVDLSTPLHFVRATDAFDGTAMPGLVATYGADDAGLRERDLSGQKVAFAPSAPGEPGSTSVDVETLRLGAQSPDAGTSEEQLREADQPAFYPTVDAFSARLGAMEQISGDESLGPRSYVLDEVYVSDGFEAAGDANKGGVFAVLEDEGDTQVADIPPDRAGGMATPSFAVTALSRALGPVGGDYEKIRAGGFEPATFFEGVQARLLGGIDLIDVIGDVGDFTAEPTKALRITSHPVLDDDGLPLAVETELTWEPDLKSGPAGLDLFEPVGGSTLKLEAHFVQSLRPEELDSTYDIEGDLGAFDLNLVGADTAFMVLTFDRLHFRARSGHKTKVVPVISDVRFAGPLEFVNQIEQYLNFGGVEPELNVTADGITAGVGLQLPTIPIGQVMLSDIAMNGRLTIPFDGQPARIRFGLSSRENPFTVTYTAIGGGGYFGIGMGLDGFDGFECAVELGAYLPMDLGVVSGSISLAAGIFFEIDMGDPDEVTLEAYIRFIGEVKALGLISVSLELYLGLGFQNELDGASKPQLFGVAEAELKIKVIIFEGSVKVTVKRTLGSQYKSFAEVYTEDHWEQYAGAFATTGGA